MAFDVMVAAISVVALAAAGCDALDERHGHRPGSRGRDRLDLPQQHVPVADRRRHLHPDHHGHAQKHHQRPVRLALGHREVRLRGDPHRECARVFKQRVHIRTILQPALHKHVNFEQLHSGR